MSRAIQLAKQGQYTCDPNPRVGCVIVKSSRISAEGWHVIAGEPHAEINAINQCDDIADSTVYVSLEPCSHHGRTPACVTRLIAGKVSEVVIAMLDPNPLVSGSGIKQLEAAGITVRYGLLEAQARELNPGFIKRMTSGKPYVRCKMAMSIDGRIALANGISQWLSSEQSRRDVHRLRAASSAILSSADTVISDDPLLNPRGLTFEFKQPTRVILDRRLRTPAEAKLFNIDGEVLVYTESKDEQRINQLSDSGAKIINLAHSETWLADVMSDLALRFELNDILVESGSVLCGALIEASLVDELIVYLAPKLMGHESKALFNLSQADNMDDIIKADLVDYRKTGQDIRLIYNLNT